MDKFELYDEVALDFPAMWPKLPQSNWVNIHDGQLIKLDVLAELLSSAINSIEVIVVVHSSPGEATILHQHQANPSQRAAFIDLGAIKDAVGVTPRAHAPVSGPVQTPGVEVRIDLGGGIVLTITRR